MSVLLRTAWSDDRHELTAARRGVGTAVVHHTVGAWSPGADKAGWLRGLEHSVTDHVAPGNSTPLAALDYNELIFPDGEVAEGRGLGYEDAATYHFNAESVSWALVGNYDTHEIPDAMLAALAGRIREAIRLGWLISYPKIIGHRDVGTFATACPGRFMEARLPDLRGLVATGALKPPAVQEEDDLPRLIQGDQTDDIWAFGDAGKWHLKDPEALNLMLAVQPPIFANGNKLSKMAQYAVDSIPVIAHPAGAK